MKSTSFFHRGFSLVEVLIGAAIILIVISGIGTSYSVILRAGRLSTTNVQASYLAAEGGEAMTGMSKEDWTAFAALSIDTPYHLEFSNGLWRSTTTPQTIDGIFTRTFTVSRVYRDGTNDIATFGTEDTLAREATIAVSWVNDSEPKNKTIVLYLFKDE